MFSNKGQKSLQMIIGLMILLVVAGVVINIFLNYVKPEKFQPKTGTSEFIQKCDSLCKSYKTTGKSSDAVKYCTKYASNIDWNGNKKAPESDTNPVELQGQWKACEDRIYCFLVTDCEGLGIQDCRDTMCYEFKQTWNETIANQTLKDRIQLSGHERCDLLDQTNPQDHPENWYLWNFNRTGWCQF